MSSGGQSYREAAGSAGDDDARDQEVASELAARLVRTAEENGPDADAARSELADVSQAISNLIADDLVRRMAVDPLSVCAVFSNHVRPFWFASSRDKLIAGLNRTAEREPLVGSFSIILRTMPIRKAEIENAGPMRRLLSVLARPWVIAFVLVPAACAAVGVVLVEGLLLRVALAGVTALLLALAFAVDSHLRRCPSCRRLLAGMPTAAIHTGSHTESVAVTTTTGASYVDRRVDSYDTIWRCVHCRHRWQR